MPKISVIFPVGDRVEFLSEAIESILGQTLTDFELVIVLDGVSDPVRQIVHGYQDARIRCFDLPIGMGVSNARNLAIAAAQAPLLALMDSDDVALPNRFERQCTFMASHPEVTVCGSNAIKLFNDGRRIPMRYPETDANIKARLLVVDSAVINPTVMMRASFIRQHGIRYDVSLRRDEDHRFYVEAMRHGAVFHGLQEELLVYRRHHKNITATREGVDQEKTRVREALWPLIFPELTGREAALLLHSMCERVQADVATAFEMVAVQNKAMRETRVFYGEGRGEIHRIVARAQGRLFSAFKKQLNLRQLAN